MKGDTEVVLMIVLFFLGAVFAAYAEEISLLPFVNTITAPIATLFAAFFGAKYAFLLQAKLKQDEVDKNNVEAANKLIFQLIRLYNKFSSIRNQFIDPHRTKTYKQYFIMPIAGVDTKDIHINYDSLSFIYNSEKLELLNELSNFEQEVSSAIEVINKRSEHHYNVIQPAVEALEIKHGPDVTSQQIDAQLGKREAQIASMSADNMIMCVDSIINYGELITKLSDLAKSNYPRHTIIGADIT